MSTKVSGPRPAALIVHAALSSLIQVMYWIHPSAKVNSKSLGKGMLTASSKPDQAKYEG